MYIDIASAMPTNRPCLPVSMPYSCATCDRSFISLQGIQSHCKAKQHRQNPECRQCNRTFVNDHALQQVVPVYIAIITYCTVTKSYDFTIKAPTAFAESSKDIDKQSQTVPLY